MNLSTFVLATALSFSLAASSPSQTSQDQTQPGSKARRNQGTASLSAGQARFVSLGELLQMRLEVTSSSGEVAFDSDFKRGNVNSTATVVPSGLIGWWPGDGDTRDISGNNFNGTLNDNAFAVSRVGQGFDFNNETGITVADNAAFNQQSFTIEAWVTAQVFTCPVSCAQFVASKSGSNGILGYEFGTMKDTGFLRLIINGGTGGGDLIDDVSINDGSFHHVVATYDGATMKIFLDGVLSAQKSLTTTINYEANSPFVIGARQFQGSTFPYNGLIDEVSFYNRALTDAEITSIFNAGVAGKLKAGTTPTGTNVSTNVGSDATITFPNVSASGTTQQIPLDTALIALPVPFTHTGLAYDIATTATTSGNINMSFHLPSFTTQSQFNFLKVLHQEGGVFVDRTVAQDFATRTLTAQVSSLSSFVIANGTTPTAVTLESSTATGFQDGRVLLEWQTGLEVSNLGFNVYREQAGRRALVNSEIIAGSALKVRPSVAGRAGYSYAWWDSSIADCGSRSADCQNVQYWLEDLDIDGHITLHGPFKVDFTGGKPPARSHAETLSHLTGGTIFTGPAAFTPEAGRSSGAVSPALFDLAGKAAMKLTIKSEGWYRVTQPELAAAGFNVRVNPRNLQLSVDGVEQPMLVAGERDKSFDSSDAIEFYGSGQNSPTSDARIYWLAAGGQPGKRINVMKTTGKPGGGSSFLTTIERRERSIYFSSLLNGEAENFFGSVITSRPVEQLLRLQHVDQSSPGSAEIEIALQGVTNLPPSPDHVVSVAVNGTIVGRVVFDGREHKVERFSIYQSNLREGENQITLMGEGGANDISLVDYIRVSYWHRYAADGDALRLTASSSNGPTQTIDGFSSPLIRVFDITDASGITETAGLIDEQKGNGYAVTVSFNGPNRTLLAITDAQIRRPAAMSLNQVSNLRNRGQGADLLMITRRELISELLPLAALRQSQKLSVAIIDIEDIYDEFSFGQKTPYAVKDFLAFSRSNWKTRPRFVLLAGDGSFDPKDFLGFGDSDLVPTKLVDTGFMETASDDWLADFDNDGVADLAIGRLPMRTDEQARLLVSKIIAYERSSPAQEVLLAADANDGFDFESSNNLLASLVPPSLRVIQVNRGRVDTETAKKILLDGIHRGQKLVNYTGHGSVNLWRGNLLDNTSAGALTNEHLPVFVMMTCLNGYFHDAAMDSLAESLLKAEHGAVAVWASSGMTLPMDQARMNQELYRQLFDSPRAMTLGEAMMRAKASIIDSDVRRTWILLGDPTTKLR